MTDTKGTQALNRIKSEAPKKTLEEFLTEKMPEIAAVLPKAYSPQKMVRMVINAVRANPAIGRCDRYSFVAGILSSMAVGLEPNTTLGHAYLIPYGGKVQFQIGYKGYLEMAYRTGLYKVVNAECVYKDDLFDYDLAPKAMQHKPRPHKKDEKPIGYYASYEKKDGTKDFKYMTWEEIDEHRKKFTKTSSADTPWKRDFDEMAKKTCMKYLFKYAEKSVEDQRIFASDETVKVEWKKDMLNVAPIYDTDNEPEEGQKVITAEEGKQIVEAAKASLDKTPEAQTEPQADTEPTTDDLRPVTDKQLSRLFAIGHGVNKEPQAIKDYAYPKYNITSLKDLNQNLYNELVKTVESGEITQTEEEALNEEIPF